MTAPTRSLASATLAPASAGEAREMVREAIADRTPLRIAGHGTWLDAGRPVRLARTLSLAGVAGIVDYVPGDLTLTARAGTTLAEIARATGAEGQWLTLDPFGDPAGTLGATVATGSYGPLAHLFGTPRDLVLGLEFVDGRGEVVRGGGRVVKNVAGFDLVRLLAGSWGTLGAITEVSVRLRARPETEATVALPVPAGADVRGLLARLRAAPLAAHALELLSARAARAVGAGDGAVILARIAGNADLVRGERRTLGEIADASDIGDGDVWARLARLEPAGAATVRLSALPSRLAELWPVASRTCDAAEGFAHATVGRGVVRCVVPSHGAGALAAMLAALPEGVTRIVERFPDAQWRGAAPAADDRLSRRARDAFDPHRLLNRGLLGEEAA